MGAAVLECAQAGYVVLQVFMEFLNAGVHLSGFNVGYGTIQRVNPLNGIVEESKPYVAIYGLGTRFNQRTAQALRTIAQYGEILVSDVDHTEEQLIRKAQQTPEGYLATCATKAISCSGPGSHDCSGQLTQAGLTRVEMTWTRWKLPTCWAR